MTITYRTNGAWGVGQGSNLTPGQVDSNFYDLTIRLGSLEDNPTEAIGIDYFETAGTQFYVHMTDHEILGPYDLPIGGIDWRGDWTPDFPYIKGDAFAYNGSVYLVLLNHTSSGTFDPGFNLGSGLDVYQLMFTSPGSALPAGGVTGQILAKRSDADFDVEWLEDNRLLPAGGDINFVLTKSSAFDYDVGWSEAFSQELSALLDVHVVSPTPENGMQLTYISGMWIAAFGTLAQLTDVNGSPSENEFLKWNGDHWTPDFVSMGEIDDVNVSSAILGDVLKFDGAVWQPVFLELGALSGVTITTPAADQVLTWNGSAWVNATAPGIDVTYQNKNHVVPYSTTAAHCLVFNVLLGLSVTGFGTADPGFTSIGDVNNTFGRLSSEYKITSAAQASKTQAIYGGANTAVDWIGIVDALKESGSLTYKGSKTGSSTNSATVATGAGVSGVVNDVIVVNVGVFSTHAGETVTGISDTAGFTWTKRSGYDLASASFPGDWFRVETWYAVASGTYTSLNVTATISNGSATVYSEIIAFNASGVDTSNPFDANSSLPSVQYSLPSEPTSGQIIVFDGLIWTNKNCNKTIGFQISSTDLLAHTTQQFIAPCDGVITELVTIVQTAVTTGGTIKVQINGVDVSGATITVANSATVGTVQHGFANGGTTAAIKENDVVTLVTASFATAGALNGMIKFVPQ